MAGIIVVGGGFAGLAAAVRLAKLGHRITLLERADELGGQLRGGAGDGYGWDGAAATTTLPAVLRDLFRKSGRPLERELELLPEATPRRHVFDDRRVLDLPTTGRGAQRAAVRDALGERAAAEWTTALDELAAPWEVLRTRALEADRFPGCSSLSRADRKTLRVRTTLQTWTRRAFTDPRLGAVLSTPVRLRGAAPGAAPCYLGVWAYVERTFGVWRPEHGMSALVDRLVARLGTRGVEVRTGVAVIGLLEHDDRVAGVRTAAGDELPADLVVWAAEPDPSPWPLVLGRLGLPATAPEPPFETVLHPHRPDHPLVVLRRDHGTAAGHTLTVLAGRATVQRPDAQLSDVDLSDVDLSGVVQRAAEGGLDLTGARRLDDDTAPTGNLAPGGTALYDRAELRRRLAPGADPVTGRVLVGVHRVGAAAFPGPGVPLVGLGAAQVATRIGPAPRGE